MSFKLEFKPIAKALERRAAEVVRDTAFGIQADIRQGMAEEKHGRDYKKSKSGRTHTASAPGESPAIDTSFLVNSIQVEADGLTAIVGTNADYAEHLEFGTVRMEPRPYFGPAFENAAPEFERRLQELAR
jgi:HK97 gp10 family phage protein